MKTSVLSIRTLLLAVIMTVGLVQTAFADNVDDVLVETILYVEKDASGSECSEDDPCGLIQDAVNMASPGDTILIGRGQFVENILVETADLTFSGTHKNQSVIVAAGGRPGAVGNAGNPLDAIFEVKAPGVTITNLTLIHPPGLATKRDAAVFAWSGSDGLVVKNNTIKRLRDARIDEPTVPGSRGVFILLSPDSEVSKNLFVGNYQDHVHLPTGGTLVEYNVMIGASRAGLSVMAPDIFPDFPSFNNVIQHNIIMRSLDDGIHIQGDANTIRNNRIINNGGYGIYLCGDDNDCYPPGANAVSEGNIVSGNIIKRNALGALGDFGIDNVTDIH